MDLLAVRPKSVRDALHHGILRVVTHHRPPLFGQHAGPGRHRHARHAHRPHREAHSGAKEASKRRFRQKIFSRTAPRWRTRSRAPPPRVRAQSAKRVRLSSPCGVRSRRARGAWLGLPRRGARSRRRPRAHSILGFSNPVTSTTRPLRRSRRARRHRTAGAWSTASPRRRTARRYRGIPSPARTRRLEKTRRSPLRRPSERSIARRFAASRRAARRPRGGRSTTEAARRSETPHDHRCVMARATRGSTARYRSTRSLSRSWLGSTNPSARTC